MRKEDIGNIAKKLSEIKDSLDELADALKSKKMSKAVGIKTRVINLQSEIGKLL